MTGGHLALFTCFSCRLEFTACPECVNTIRVDPETGWPPDVEVIDGKAVHKEPTPEATARSIKQPTCDRCVATRNETWARGGEDAQHIEGYWELAEDRHRRAHA